MGSCFPCFQRNVDVHEGASDFRFSAGGNYFRHVADFGLEMWPSRLIPMEVGRPNIWGLMPGYTFKFQRRIFLTMPLLHSITSCCATRSCAHVQTLRSILAAAFPDILSA